MKYENVFEVLYNKINILRCQTHYIEQCKPDPVGTKIKFMGFKQIIKIENRIESRGD